MVVYDEHILNKIPYIHAYSNQGRYIVKDGAEYGQYWFKKEREFTFTEGDLIDVDPDPEIDDSELLDILMGVTE